MQAVRNGWLRLGAILIEQGLISEPDAARMRALPMSTAPHGDPCAVDLRPFRALRQTQSFVETPNPHTEEGCGLYSGLLAAVGEGGPVDSCSTAAEENTQLPGDGTRPCRFGHQGRPPDMEARAASLQGRFHDLRAEVKHLRAQAEQAQQGITNELARLETLYASLWESEAALEKLRSGWTAMLAMVSSFRSSTEVQTGGPLEEAGPWSLRERHQRKPGA